MSNPTAEELLDRAVELLAKQEYDRGRFKGCPEWKDEGAATKYLYLDWARKKIEESK